MGADLVHRRRRDHDAADRLSCRAVWPQAPVHDLDRRLHARLDAVRNGHVDRPDRRLPADPGRLWRGPGAAVAIGADGHLPAGAPGHGDVVLGHGDHDRPDHRAGSRRLAHRKLQLAVGLLHQRADRHSGVCRDVVLPDRNQKEFGQARLVRLCRAERGDRRFADPARSGRGARLARLLRDPDRGDDQRRGVLALPGAYLHDQEAVRRPWPVPRPQLCRRHALRLHHRRDLFRPAGPVAVVFAGFDGLSDPDCRLRPGAARRRHLDRDDGGGPAGRTPRYPFAAGDRPGAVRLGDVGYEWMDPRCLGVDGRHQRHHPGRRHGLFVRAAAA